MKKKQKQVKMYDWDNKNWKPELCCGCNYFKKIVSDELGENRRVCLIQCISEVETAGGCCGTPYNLKKAVRE